MSTTPQTTQPICNHERRPGTTVCLHCRHNERIAAGERRNKLLLRAAALGIVLVVGGVTVAMSANALRGRLNQEKKAEAVPAQVVASAGSTPTDSAPPAATVPADTTAATPAATPNVVPQPQPPVAQQGITSHPPFAPVIAAGQSTLADSATATRTDSVVVVSFDTPALRTRMPEKFEVFLRTTLRRVYGAAIDSSLAKIPQGGLVGQGNLLYDLPTRGIHIPVSPTWKLDVFPEIRPGQDGPLVVRYRASLSPVQ